MLEKQTSYDHSITELGIIQVRKITRIFEDGRLLSKAYERHVVNPGNTFADEDERTKALISTIHSPTCIAKYKEHIEAIERIDKK